jgi:hypothetical protein
MSVRPPFQKDSGRKSKELAFGKWKTKEIAGNP